LREEGSSTYCERKQGGGTITHAINDVSFDSIHDGERKYAVLKINAFVFEHVATTPKPMKIVYISA